MTQQFDRGAHRFPSSRLSRMTYLLIAGLALVWLGCASFCGRANAGDIHEAAKAGDAEKVTAMLRGDPMLANSKDKNGWMPLHLAARYGHLQVAKILITNKADLNVRGADIGTPLYAAVLDEVQFDDFPVTDPTSVPEVFKGKKILTPVDFAENGLLLGFYPGPIFVHDGRIDVVALLLANGADPNIRVEHDETALHRACFNWFLPSIDILIKHGADVNAKTSFGRTPLQMSGSKKVVMALLARGADPYIKDNDGKSFFDCSSPEMKKIIIEITKNRSNK